VSLPALNFLLDALLLLLFVALLAISTLLHAVFPPATQSDGWSLWSLNYDTWRLLQFACLILFALAVLVHLILHWVWICNFVTSRVARRRGRTMTMHQSARTLCGVTFLITVLTFVAGVIMAAQLAVRSPATQAARATDVLRP
jgi:hypothetical protein